MSERWSIVWKQIEDKIKKMNTTELEGMADCFIDIYDKIPSEELTEDFDICEYASDHPEIAAEIIKTVVKISKRQNRKRQMCTI